MQASRTKSTTFIAIFSLCYTGLFSKLAHADDWPQWRGPQRDGVWRESGIVEKFSSPQLPIKWRAEIGPGYSGPTVANGRVYITDRLVEPTQIERVHCFDAANGKPLWIYQYECPYDGVGYAAGPRASVLVDEGRAYSLGGGTYTGIEAVSNNVQTLREPVVRTGKLTMFYMATSLAFTAGGIMLRTKALIVVWCCSASRST
jgi:hypothetical protein